MSYQCMFSNGRFLSFGVGFLGFTVSPMSSQASITWIYNCVLLLLQVQCACSPLLLGVTVNQKQSHQFQDAHERRQETAQFGSICIDFIFEFRCLAAVSVWLRTPSVGAGND